MIDRPIWTETQLEAARQRSTALFRQQRMTEPLENYLNAFEEYQSVIEDLLESTVDLARPRAQAAELLAEPRSLEVVRYLAGPPISDDDLKILAEATLSGQKLRADPAMVERIIRVIRDGLDRRRFPWVVENREATAAPCATTVPHPASPHRDPTISRARSPLAHQRRRQTEDHVERRHFLADTLIERHRSCNGYLRAKGEYAR